MTRLLDRLACRVGIWALRRLFGANCPTDVRDDWPGEIMACVSSAGGCDAGDFG